VDACSQGHPAGSPTCRISQQGTGFGCSAHKHLLGHLCDVGSWLAVSGGARDLLMTWRLSWVGPGPGPGVSCEWVNMRPPRGGLKPKAHSRVSHRRLQGTAPFAGLLAVLGKGNPCFAPSTSSPYALAPCARVVRHPQTLLAFCMPPQSWVMLSALHAVRWLQCCTSRAVPLPLHQRPPAWVAAWHCSPHRSHHARGGLLSSRLAAASPHVPQGHFSRESDLRIMALSAFLLPAPVAEQLSTPNDGPASPPGEEAPAPHPASLATATPARMPGAGSASSEGSAGWGEVAFVAAASSDASLSLLACHLAQRGQQAKRAWQPVGALQYHTCPVLCTAHVEVHAGDAEPSCLTGRSRQLLFSGATDGSVAAWDLSPAAERYLAHCGAAGAAQAAAGGTAGAAAANNGHKDEVSRGGLPGGGAPGPWQELELEHVLCLEGVHQSGVNAMAAVQLGEA
jgi:hypothetical protein